MSEENDAPINLRSWNREALARHDGIHTGMRLLREEYREREVHVAWIALGVLLSALVGMAAGWIARSWLDWNQFQNMFGPTL